MMRREREPGGTAPTIELPARPPAETNTARGGGDGEAPEAARGGGEAAAGGPTADTAAGPSAAPLRRIGRFVLLERLGAGGMGVVYAAFDERLERKVAIKLVAAHRGDEPAQARLLREAQAQAQLSHPNVVTVYEVGTLPEGGLFLAMELVRGQTLRDWQRDGARTWRELVAMYAAAGEGLAAAHRAGIVHRDFKPDNVLIGDDGRVRVADFGLAAAAGPAAAPSVRDPDTMEAAPGRAPALTAAGAVAGTPGYMAPEQLAGAALDARTDQFGFCAALYEALHGERPYPDLAFARGERPPPRRTAPDPAYPRWLWDVVMRGLSLEPERRFPSLDALCTELTRRRGRARRRALIAAGLAGGLGLAATTAAALTARPAPPPCPLATADLSGIWDGAVKQRAEAALRGTGAPYAARVWASTEAAFDRYAERWLGAQQVACEATHVRHAQSAELLDQRMECLARRRRQLAAAAEVLQTRPAQAVEHAGELLASLGDLEPCADTAVLLELGARGEPAAAGPAAAYAREQAAEVRRHLARADALLAADDVAAADPAVAEAARLAADLDEPVRAEVAYAQGRARLARGEVASAVAAFDRAIELAVASRHDELPADVWLTLALRGGKIEQRPAEIEAWLAQGEAWLRRLGHASDARRVDLEHARGGLALAAGDARRAVAALSRALELAAARWGQDDPRLIAILRDRATAYGRLQEARRAVADAERALALGLAAWGPAYPDLARTRRILGLLYVEQLGDVVRGERELTLALESYRARTGADSIEVANCEQALSQAGQYRGDYAAALDHAERAERIYAARWGAGHPRRGEALMGIGVLRYMRGDLAGSLAAYEAAYPILRAALGEAHTTVGLLLSNTGETLLALDRPEPARARFERALAILERGLGAEHADLALPLKGLGLARLRQGRPADALAPLERALALRTRAAAASDPQEIAELRWALARALRALGREPARARELAEAAAAGYRGLGGESAGRVQEIARWLAASR
jgi:tetratricopeptide (TPR) repeat protein